MKLLIPSRKQFCNWTMLSRLGYIASVVTFIVGGIQIVLWIVGIYYWLSPAPRELSAADLLVIDQNPTEIKLVKVTRDETDKNPPITIYLKNTSSVTAKNVHLTFYNHKGLKYSYAKQLPGFYEGSSIDIRPGATQEFKIAPTNRYEEFFGPSLQPAKLLRVSSEIQSEKPFELEEIACGKTDDYVNPCSFRTNGLSTIIDIKYGSIFGQKYQTLTQFYNTFLVGEVEFLPNLHSE